MRKLIHNLSKPMALICTGVLLVGSVAEGKELLKNPTFKGNKMEPWHIAMEGGFDKNRVTVDEGSIRIRTISPGPHNYVRIMQPVKIKEGKSYTLTFEAKAEAKDLENEKPIWVMVCEHKGDWDSYGLRETVALEADWKKYEFTFTATEIDKDNPPVFRTNFGNIVGNVFFRGFSLVDESSGGLRPRGLLPTKKGPPPPRKW